MPGEFAQVLDLAGGHLTALPTSLSWQEPSTQLSTGSSRRSSQPGSGSGERDIL